MLITEVYEYVSVTSPNTTLRRQELHGPSSVNNASTSKQELRNPQNLSLLSVNAI